MSAHKYIYVTINIEEEGDQFVSMCPELGTASCGDTEQEALDNLREAITVHLNALEEVGERERLFQERNIEVLYAESAVPSAPPVLQEQAACPSQHILVPVGA